MAIYKLAFDKETAILSIGFNPEEPASNSELVSFVEATLKGEEFSPSNGFCGEIIKINGAASLPLACVITHKVAHLFSAVAIFDPKIIAGGGYVVSVSHNPSFKLGDIIPQ